MTSGRSREVTGDVEKNCRAVQRPLVAGGHRFVVALTELTLGRQPGGVCVYGRKNIRERADFIQSRSSAGWVCKEDKGPGT